eukprot:1162075-Pelagomonas_calceolata.AAC.21
MVCCLITAYFQVTSLQPEFDATMGGFSRLDISSGSLGVAVDRAGAAAASPPPPPPPAVSEPTPGLMPPPPSVNNYLVPPPSSQAEASARPGVCLIIAKLLR